MPHKGFRHSEESRRKMSLAHTGQSGPDHPRWKGGQRLTRGYKAVLDRSKNKYVLEHHAVMEEAIKRPVRSKEIVHHWDEDKLNNEIGNLALLRSPSAHARLHQFANRHCLKVIELKFDQPWLRP